MVSSVGLGYHLPAITNNMKILMVDGFVIMIDAGSQRSRRRTEFAFSPNENQSTTLSTHPDNDRRMGDDGGSSLSITVSDLYVTPDFSTQK